MVPWDAEGGGGGMLGGVDRGCVFTSAGESGIAAAFFSFLSTAVSGVRGGKKKRTPVKQAERGGVGTSPATPSAWPSPRPPAAGFGAVLPETRVGVTQLDPRWLRLCPQSQTQSQGLANPRSAPGVFTGADISPTWGQRVGSGQPIAGGLQEPEAGQNGGLDPHGVGGGGGSGTADRGVGQHPLRQPPPALPEGLFRGPCRPPRPHF